VILMLLQLTLASNNIKSVAKSIGVKVSPILLAKVSVLVSAIFSAHSIGTLLAILFASIINRPVNRVAARLAGVMAGCIHLRRVAGNTV